MSGASSSQAQLILQGIAGNQFYNNTSDVVGLSSIPANYANGTGTNPGFGTNENFAPGLALVNKTIQFPTNGLSGKTNTVNNALPGAIQLNAASSGSGASFAFS